MAKAKKDNKVVENVVENKEVSVIDQKIAEFQARYNSLSKDKQLTIKKLNAIDQELLKVTGAYTEFMKMKEELTPKDKVEDKQEVKEDVQS